MEIKDDGRKKGVSKPKTPLDIIGHEILYGPGVSKPEGEVPAIYRKGSQKAKEMKCMCHEKI